MYSAERGGGIAVGSVLGQPALLCELLQQKRKEKKRFSLKAFCLYALLKNSTSSQKLKIPNQY